MAQNSDTTRSLVGLVIMAAIAGLVIAVSENLSRDRIADNRNKALLATLHQVIDPALHDNDLTTSHRVIPADPLLNPTGPGDAYLARKRGEPAAVLLTTKALDGYNGSIELLVAIHMDGTLGGVRVLSHRETPGLGDAIEAKRSDWILQFSGLSLDEPPRTAWALTADGGHFDALTGATVTPRAVVKAVRNALLYFERHHESIKAWPVMDLSTDDSA